MLLEKAQTIIEEMRKCYDIIAEHFAQTREKVWQDGTLIVSYIPENASVLDIGCGSGRLFSLLNANQKRTYCGIDASENIIVIANAQYGAQGAQFIQGDILAIPCKSETFDVVVAAAVLHHIPSDALRMQALRECARVLKQDGLLILTNWNVRADAFQKRFHLSESSFLNPQDGYDRGDVQIPWHKPDGTKVCDRYVHAFTLEELCERVKNAGFFIERSEYIHNGIVSNEKEGSNILIIVEKKKDRGKIY